MAQGAREHGERVTSLRSHHKIPVYSQQVRESEGWMTLTLAATKLAVSANTLRLAAQRGEVEALHPLSDGPWIFKRAALETDAARRLARGIRRTPVGHDSQQQNLNLSMTSQVGQYERLYNHERLHQALDYRLPRVVFEEVRIIYQSRRGEKTQVPS